MAKKYILFIILNGILCGTSYVQTTLNIQSDVVISNAAGNDAQGGQFKGEGVFGCRRGIRAGCTVRE